MDKMTKELRPLELTESETIEFKRSLAERNEILDTISAFSNTRGGTIFIGVEDNGNVSGVNIGNGTIETLVNEIKQNTDPKIFPTIEVREINQKQVIVITVAEYPKKPVFAKDRVFLRVGRSNQRSSAEKIRQLFSNSQAYKWDHQLVPGSKLADIDPTRIKHFLQKAEEERNTFFDSPCTTRKFLEALNLIIDNQLTNASLLLFGKHPQRLLIQSEIRCARFQGTDPVDFEDMQVIPGSIIEQVPAVLNFIRRHINVAVEITGEPQRKETWEYPKEAIREAIVNAICHRNYEDTGNVQIRIFDDRLEIWNPGLLPEGITIDLLRKDHQSRPRNDLIARCFFLIKYIEQWGTGTNRMIKLCQKAQLPALEFIELEDCFIVRFWRKQQTFVKKKSRRKPQANLTATQRKIIKYLEENRTASANDLVKHLRITRRTVQRNVKELSNRIKWTGKSTSDPKGRYVLNED